VLLVELQRSAGCWQEAAHGAAQSESWVQGAPPTWQVETPLPLLDAEDALVLDEPPPEALAVEDAAVDVAPPVPAAVLDEAPPVPTLDEAVDELLATPIPPPPATPPELLALVDEGVPALVLATPPAPPIAPELLAVDVVAVAEELDPAPPMPAPPAPPVPVVLEAEVDDIVPADDELLEVVAAEVAPSTGKLSKEMAHEAREKPAIVAPNASLFTTTPPVPSRRRRPQAQRRSLSSAGLAPRAQARDRPRRGQPRRRRVMPS
jgi:hypothetical protein